MSRVELAKIRSLTFYKDRLTKGRRTSPLPQLVCHGAPCKRYTPDAIHCVSLPGGSGTEVDWKCEADLPESLRFGKVEVGCEGWSRPGDRYVLEGSCSLDYRLVQIPSALRNDDTSGPIFKTLKGTWGWWSHFDWGALVFYFVWVGLLAYILYLFIFNRGSNRPNANRPRQNRPRPPNEGGGWFGGRPDNQDNNDPPPPPYRKNPENNNNNARAAGWRPGFWTGALTGGLANHLWQRSQANQRPRDEPRTTAYDWEQDQARPRSSFFSTGQSSSSRRGSNDRGEGSSSMGSMRSASGFGGSTVR
ncbi:DUF1183-domain-containing protein [Pluteus cervinus]|uniref:DUF1183-domain-containing protein n=1 Tax=Pluteus cervinus TaxID=181527 RepID=A0ACD3BBI5_9AGAR|nr:DUF1183-domain-containing protein [Pluteus cervinus]